MNRDQMEIFSLEVISKTKRELDREELACCVNQCH